MIMNEQISLRPEPGAGRVAGVVRLTFLWSNGRRTMRRHRAPLHRPTTPPTLCCLAVLITSSARRRRTHRRSSANGWPQSVRLDIHVDAAHEDGAAAVAQSSAHHAEGHAENRHCSCSGARVSGIASTRGRGAQARARGRRTVSEVEDCLEEAGHLRLDEKVVDLHAKDAGAEHGTRTGRKKSAAGGVPHRIQEHIAGGGARRGECRPGPSARRARNGGRE